MGAEDGARAPFYEVIVVSTVPDLTVRTASGVNISCEQNLLRLNGNIDTLIIGGLSLKRPMNSYPEVVDWIKVNEKKIRRVCSVCIGAFILAEAGLLSGKNATTHWHY